MGKSITPWAYRKANSPLHRMPAGVKLIFLLLLSLAAFFPSLAVLTGIILILFLLSFVAGIGPAALLRGSGPLLLVIIAVFLFQAVEFSPLNFNTLGLKEAVIFCVRIAAAYSAGALLFSVTTTGEIRKSLIKAEALLRLKKLNLSLYLSLMLAFLPRFFEIWEDLNISYKSRAGKKNLSSLKIIIPLAIERMMIKAAETAEALEVRGSLL